MNTWFNPNEVGEYVLYGFLDESLPAVVAAIEWALSSGREPPADVKRTHSTVDHLVTQGVLAVTGGARHYSAGPNLVFVPASELKAWAFCVITHLVPPYLAILEKASREAAAWYELLTTDSEGAVCPEELLHVLLIGFLADMAVGRQLRRRGLTAVPVTPFLWALEKGHPLPPATGMKLYPGSCSGIVCGQAWRDSMAAGGHPGIMLRPNELDELGCMDLQPVRICWARLAKPLQHRLIVLRLVAAMQDGAIALVPIIRSLYAPRLSSWLDEYAGLIVQEVILANSTIIEDLLGGCIDDKRLLVQRTIFSHLLLRYVSSSSISSGILSNCATRGPRWGSWLYVGQKPWPLLTDALGWR